MTVGFGVRALAGAGLVLASAGFAAANTVVVNGGITRLGGAPVGTNVGTNWGPAGLTTTSVDYIQFSVGAGGGLVTIDVLSCEYDAQLNNFVGGLPIDLNGDGEIAFVDSAIFLFSGSVAAINQVAYNDDAQGFVNPTIGLADGTISYSDSFLSLNLAAGDYVLAISDWNFDLNGALTGTNTNGSGPLTRVGGTNYTNDHGDYRVTIESTAGVTLIPLPPAAWAGLAGLGMVAGLRRLRRTA